MGDRGIIMDFFLASIATSGACLVSNPMEVVKTRMQLQGELAPKVTRRGIHSVIQYRNFAHAFYTIGRTEGLYGIQRGLGPGIWYQIFMNGPRLGLFEPLQKVYGATDPTALSYPLRNICAAATSGMIGASIGSPFYLVKARIQAASSVETINAQYAYNGMMDGFRQIVKTDGWKGLYRGATASIPRVAIGSGTQLATYTQAKTLVIAAGFEDGIKVHLGSSILTGLAVTTAMNPMDVVSTRIYSQKVVNGKGKLYSGVMDCIVKTLKSEGIRGFYKGWAAHYMRLGPHTIFTFIFWEEVKKIAAELGY
ncbi:unnamed protein product [Peronospora farinosa]|uniref:Uncharacterized protein n=1 Tax=Peronospora farinosa TaxID=134698 RepID=A0AAV0TJL0_9STRA|nr:unnamed protein product [Peronospora farinosa]CAI5720722.1 unnamed protein product [Peronospora farinosa]